MKPKCKTPFFISYCNYNNEFICFRPDENVTDNQNQRRSERARKPVKQMYLEENDVPKSSPRTVTPKKNTIMNKLQKSNTHSLLSTAAVAENTSLADSTIYIELDPFAPPPRLSLNGVATSVQSPFASKTATPKRAAVPAAALPAFSGGILFEQLNSPGIALKTVINDWMNMYESDLDRKGTVSLLLVNMILWSCRVEDDIKPENFVTESASQILHDLQERIEPAAAQTKSDFPLLERNKKHRIFRTQFVEFWQNWASSVLPAVKDLELIEKVILPWLISMSSAAYRPIRFAATLAVLNIVQGCCKACISMQKELETGSRVMNSKKSLANKKSIEASSSRMAEIEKLMQTSIDAVFVQRYRDVDAILREKCVESVHSWINTYPEVFLDNAYLRYIGWSLSDKVSHIRLASLSAWKTICCRTDFRPALTNFVNRFKTRLFEVLSRDVEKACRESAGSVIDILFSGSFLEVDEMSFIDDLVFSGDSTISNLKQLMSQRIFNLPLDRISSSIELLNRFSSFIVPYINSESSAETNNFILRQLISNLHEHFPILSERSLTASLLKSLISHVPEENNSEDTIVKQQSEISEKISSLLAVLFAQVQSIKSRKGNCWTFEDSSELFNFLNDLIKFINDNEREIYSKDIFYIFSLFNEVEPSNWLEIAGVTVWESLLPILSELFCSIDDLESAKVATIFFKRSKSIGALKSKALECIEMGKNRLLNDLLRKIPGNMREALKIKDNTILTLVLPLSHINLITSLEIEDSSTVLTSILNMTKLIDEFVTIEEAYKTTIWSCSLRLVFHELMWKMLEYKRNPTEEDCDLIIDIKDRLIDLISPSDFVPENCDSMTLESFDRSCTEINLLSDLALLFCSSSTANPANSASWGVVILEDQISALLSFVKTVTRIVSESLPRREQESFELARAVKKSYSSIMASLGKLFSLDVLPSKALSGIFLTFGFGGEVSDAVIRVVIERFLSKISLDRSVPVISASLQESYLLSVMSSEYEHLIQSTTIQLAKIFNEHLRTTCTETSMFSLHASAIEFFKSDCPQRSEFLGKIMSSFSWNLTSKQAEDLIVLLKSLNYSDSFVKTYQRSLEKISSKGNVAQRILMKRSSMTNSSSVSSPSVAQKISKLEVISEDYNPVDEEEDEKAIDYVGEVDMITQKENYNEIEDQPGTPALLRRKVMRY